MEGKGMSCANPRTWLRQHEPGAVRQRAPRHPGDALSRQYANAYFFLTPKIFAETNIGSCSIVVSIFRRHCRDRGSIPCGVKNFISTLKNTLCYSKPQVFPLWWLNPYMDPVYLLNVVCVVNVCPAQVVVLQN